MGAGRPDRTVILRVRGVVVGRADLWRVPPEEAAPALQGAGLEPDRPTWRAVAAIGARHRGRGYGVRLYAAMIAAVCEEDPRAVVASDRALGFPGRTSAASLRTWASRRLARLVLPGPVGRVQ